MGLFLGFSTLAWGQSSLPAPAGPSRMAAPILVGSREGTARRKALLKAIEDWKTLLPDDAKDALGRKYLPALRLIKEDASGLGPGQQVEPVERRFEDWKQAFLTELYQRNKERFSDDPARFQEFMQRRLDAMTAIRDKKQRAPSQSKKLDELKAKISGAPDAAALDAIYDKLQAGKTALTGAVRAVSFSGIQPRAIEAIFIQKAALPTPERIAAPPPPAKLAPVSYNPLPAAASALSNVISAVSATARRYANQVADAIVNFSRKLNLDERLEAAFVWAESAFNPHATSTSGAMGLGQLMPGTAAGLGVRDAYDIDQNVRGSTVFVKSLMNRFSSDEEMRYTQGLYAWGKTQVQQGRPAGEVWKDIFARTPMGVKNAIAAYNAGPGAVSRYGNYDRLPVSHTAYAERHGTGYWQTIHYVPAVLRHYFDVMLSTPSRPSSPRTSYSV